MDCFEASTCNSAIIPPGYLIGGNDICALNQPALAPQNLSQVDIKFNIGVSQPFEICGLWIYLLRPIEQVTILLFQQQHLFGRTFNT